MGEIKDKSIESEIGLKRIPFSSPKENDNAIPEMMASNRSYTIVLVIFTAFISALYILLLSLEKPIEGKQVLLILLPTFGYIGILIYYHSTRYKRIASKLVQLSAGRIAELEKNQKAILKEFEAGHFRSVQLAKATTRLEFEESVALDLDVMIARDGKLIEIGEDGNETILGEVENNPVPATKKRFIIGD